MHFQPGATKRGANINSLPAINSSPKISQITNISHYNRLVRKTEWSRSYFYRPENTLNMYRYAEKISGDINSDMYWFYHIRFGGWVAVWARRRRGNFEVFLVFLREKCFKKWSICGPKTLCWRLISPANPWNPPQNSVSGIYEPELMEMPSSPNESRAHPRTRPLIPPP